MSNAAASQWPNKLPMDASPSGTRSGRVSITSLLFRDKLALVEPRLPPV